MLLAADRAALVLIDFQEKLAPAIDGAEDQAREAVRLATAARLLGVPVLATEQLPDGLGRTVAGLRDLPQAMLAKSSFDGCAGCDLVGAVGSRTQVVVTGWEAHVCVLQTALGLMARGKTVFVVADAVGSRKAASKTAALSRLRDAGATVVTTEMAVFEWLGDAAHPRFKDVLRLVK